MDVADLFPGATDVVYLNTASMALGNRPAAEALRTAVTEWVEGRFSWTDGERAGEELRAVAAGLLGVLPEDVGLTAGAAGGAGTVAAQLGEARAGANVVVPARDFTSNFLAWALLEAKGYELRTVPDVDGELSLDSFARLVDDGTAVIATSLVQSYSGFRVDLEGLKQLAADHGSWLVLDASQAFGAIEIDVEGVSALFSCSHKWSLGTRGVGYLYVVPEIGSAFRPVLPGWKSVTQPMTSFYGPDVELVDTLARLDVSWPWLNPIADLQGLRIIEATGIAAIERHNQELVSALEERGLVLPFTRERRSSIVSIEVPDPERTHAEIRGRGIIASFRAGRLRLSLHLYNTLDDVDAVVEAVGL